VSAFVLLTWAMCVSADRFPPGTSDEPVFTAEESAAAAAKTAAGLKASPSDSEYRG
jgi:hypothetical protein